GSRVRAERAAWPRRPRGRERSPVSAPTARHARRRHGTSSAVRASMPNVLAKVITGEIDRAVALLDPMCDAVPKYIDDAPTARMLPFANRFAAGRLLGRALGHHAQTDAVVLGIARGGRAAVSLLGRTAILVDEAAITGCTLASAIAGVRRRGASRVVVATPVGSEITIADLRRIANQVVCLATPARLRRVTAWYTDL